jgi:hypothetical protein
MRHINYVLKPATINNAKAQDKRYVLTDGGGLALEVMPSGSKTWPPQVPPARQAREGDDRRMPGLHHKAGA